MRDRFLPALITLIAGAVICIIDIYRKASLLSSLKRLLLVLIIFYIIGLIAKAVIKKALEYRPDVSDDEVDTEAEDSDSDDKEENSEKVEADGDNSNAKV